MATIKSKVNLTSLMVPPVLPPELQEEFWIKIDDGNTFEGTVGQFSDTFFSTVSKAGILAWAEKCGSGPAKVEFSDKIPASFLAKALGNDKEVDLEEYTKRVNAVCNASDISQKWVRYSCEAALQDRIREAK